MISKKVKSKSKTNNILDIALSYVHVPRLQRRIHSSEITALENEKKVNYLNDQLQDLKLATAKLSNIQLVVDNLQQKIDFLENRDINTAPGENNMPSLFANDHILDKFYGDFEDRFRGSEEMIYDRLSEYIPLFKRQNIDYANNPVLDIGSGRGEFLKLLKDNNYNAIGLDINQEMVDRSLKMGYEVSQGDAETFLKKSKSQRFGAITGFHIVEHIPFNNLLRILNSCHRALISDGFVIFETPNPENLRVGSTTFYMDPSHLHPLPPDLLAFTLEQIGFRNVEILRLHSEDEKMSDSMPKSINDLLYGPRDYAVIGYK